MTRLFIACRWCLYGAIALAFVAIEALWLTLTTRNH